MPISSGGDIIGEAILASLDAYIASLEPGQTVDRGEMFRAIGRGIAAGLVAPGVGTAAVAGVTPGLGTGSLI